MNRIGIIVAGALLALMVAFSTMFIVDQRQYAAIYALGEIKTVITEPGLYFKLPPPFQNVVFLDRRIQSLDSPESKPIFTAEKKRGLAHQGGVERRLLGRRRGGGRQRRDADGLAGREARGGLGALAVHAHLAGAAQLLDGGLGEAGEVAAEPPVEPDLGLVVGDRALGDAHAPRSWRSLAQ